MRKRVLQSTISVDEDVARLTDFEFRVWVMALPHADNFGIVQADPQTFKAQVDPRSKHRVSKYARAIKRIARLKLWKLYEVGGRHYVRYKPRSFERINKAFIKNRMEPLYPMADQKGKVTGAEADETNHIELALQHWWGPKEVMSMGWGVKTQFAKLALEHGRESVIKAIEEAAFQGKKSFAYVRAIVEKRAEKKSKPNDALSRYQKEK